MNGLPQGQGSDWEVDNDSVSQIMKYNFNI